MAFAERLVAGCWSAGSAADDVECAAGLRHLLEERLQPLTAEVDIENFITGLGRLGMAPWHGAGSPGSQRSGAAQVLTHQGKSSTSDERKK